MKIVFIVTHLLSGGAERTVTYLSSYFVQQGMDVTILSLTDKIFYEPDRNVKIKTLHINKTGGKLIERIILAVRRVLKINWYFITHKPDVVISLLPDRARYVLSVRKIKKFKLITSERNDPASVTDKNEIALKDKIYRASDGIVFQTQRAMEYYAPEIQAKGIVIHNAVGNEYVYNMPEITERKKKIVAIGRLNPQKDYDTLLKAYQIVAGKHPDYILEIFGGGSEEARLKQLAKQLGIENHVSFMGIQKDAIVQAADASCYVMSSKHEGMPNALMEAMAAGLPCVSTDCPNGPAELIEPGKSGLLVPVGDSEKLAEAILKMIEDTAFAENCGRNAKDILKTHAIDVKAKEYMDYIKKIYNGDKA